ncbi:MAG: coproporphyrinogen dehydrogenase HemZ [Tissierellia bacterium]|nr:coproporphyrinogen dehydrogenase HemZ [Tissierellia bacterium]
MISLCVEPEKYYNEIFNLVRQFYPLEDINKEGLKFDLKLNFFIGDESVIMQYEKEDLVQERRHYYERDSSIESNERIYHSSLVKKSVKYLLNELDPSFLPWGVLTGVRPVKIVHSLLDKGMNENEIISRLKFLEISDENILRMIDITNIQRNLVYPLKKDRLSIYIHIPFCPSKCAYCSYNTQVPDELRNNISIFLKTLYKEFEALFYLIKEFEIDTIYIGGGTPTVLNIEELDIVLKLLSNISKAVREYTVEAGRPDTITYDKLKIIKEYGIDRISINPQTMNDATLKSIGRLHTVKDIKNVFEMARKFDFKTINSDLIIGLEDENLDDIKYTLSEIEKLSPENLTIHTLSIKRGARYMDNYGKYSFETIQEMMDYSKLFARVNSYKAYYLYRQKNILGNLENIGYAKEGHESIYNIQMMEERSTILALGMGGVSKFFFPDENRHESYRNFNDLKLYVDNIHDSIKIKSEFLKEIIGG